MGLTQFSQLQSGANVTRPIVVLPRFATKTLSKKESDGSERGEIEIATNVRLSPLYIADRQDEVQFLQWKTRHIKPILNQIDEQREEPWNSQTAKKINRHNRIRLLA
jgi:hypothetical protein